MKINGIELVGDSFAYDGCHKIYIIENEIDRVDAIDSGYDFLPIRMLKETFYNSCDLRFIYNWSLDKTYVGQFEDADFS